MFKLEEAEDIKIFLAYYFVFPPTQGFKYNDVIICLCVCVRERESKKKQKTKQKPKTNPEICLTFLLFWEPYVALDDIKKKKIILWKRLSRWL